MKEHWSTEVRSVIAIALALLLPIGVYLRLGVRIDHTARDAFIEACQGENVVRAQFLDFVDSTVNRSEKAVQATLMSPDTSGQQKLVATQNLLALRLVSKDAHDKTKQLSCVYPPASAVP